MSWTVWWEISLSVTSHLYTNFHSCSTRNEIAKPYVSWLEVEEEVETGPPYITLAILEFHVSLELSETPHCLCLPSVGIKGVRHQNLQVINSYWVDFGILEIGTKQSRSPGFSHLLLWKSGLFLTCAFHCCLECVSLFVCTSSLPKSNSAQLANQASTQPYSLESSCSNSTQLSRHASCTNVIWGWYNPEVWAFRGFLPLNPL